LSLSTRPWRMSHPCVQRHPTRSVCVPALFQTVSGSSTSPDGQCSPRMVSAPRGKRVTVEVLVQLHLGHGELPCTLLVTDRTPVLVFVRHLLPYVIDLLTVGTPVRIYHGINPSFRAIPGSTGGSLSGSR
jgi:hypothetical protein